MATSQTTTFDGSQVVLTIDGEVVEGRGEDFVSLTPEGDRVSSSAGTDGEVTINILNDRRYTMAVKVRAGTAGSVQMDRLRRQRDEKTKTTFEVGLKYIPSGESWVSRVSWLQSDAPINFGVEADVEEWTVGIAKLEGDRALRTV